MLRIWLHSITIRISGDGFGFGADEPGGGNIPTMNAIFNIGVKTALGYIDHIDGGTAERPLSAVHASKSTPNKADEPFKKIGNHQMKIILSKMHRTRVQRQQRSECAWGT